MFSCTDLEHEDKEFYKKEIYIVSSLSTSAKERDIVDATTYDFIDTVRFINTDYDHKMVKDVRDHKIVWAFKVGSGGSLPLDKDLLVKVAFDQEKIDDINTLRNSNFAVPDKSLYTTNIPYNETTKTFDITIPKGLASAVLKFEIPINRDTKDIYKNFAMALKIVDVGEAVLSRLYHSFAVAGVVITEGQTIDWAGLPFPRIPTGRYVSAAIQGNGGENRDDGKNRIYKYITPMGKDYDGQYVIWGTAVWSFDKFGFHGAGWMYNKFSTNKYDKFTLEPIVQENLQGFPARTFNYSTTQKPTHENEYDPITKTITLTYLNVIGKEVKDVLTYVDDNLDFVTYSAGMSPQSWEQVRAKGFNFWLPIDDPINWDE